MPTISKKGQDRQGPKSQKALARETKVFYIIAGVAAATLLLHLVAQVVWSWQNGARLDRELEAHKAARVLALYEAEQKFQQELAIAKNAATERLAAKNHAAEMARRKTWPANLAVSDREKAMMQMKALKPAAGEAMDEFLKKLVKLACPPKSGIGISPGTAGGWRVEVAFPYKRITEANSNYKAFLPGYYLEVKKTSAGIVQDVLTFGAPYAIEEVVVRCQTVTNIQTPEGVKKEKRDLFGISMVNDGRDWSPYSRAEIEQLWTMTTNEFPALIANLGSTP